MQAALTLFSDRSEASFSEIAVKAGVGRATLHRHFRNRAALIDALCLQCMDEMDRAVLAAESADMRSADRLASMFTATIPLGDRYSFLQHQYATNEDVRSRYLAQLDWLNGLVVALKAERTIADDVPDYWLVSQIDHLIWTAWRAVRDGNITVRDAVALAMRSILHGLGEQR